MKLPEASLAGVRVGGAHPVAIVGVINVSPESFYRDSVAASARELRQRAARMVADGAQILDVGAMSTAPYKRGWIPEEEEIRRLVRAVTTLSSAINVPISVDTQRASVAAAALAAGASIINDVSGLEADPAMAALAARAGGVILMASESGASKGRPIVEVARLLRRALRRAAAAGIKSKAIVLDPGIGFFRHAALPWQRFDCSLLAELGRLRQLGRPLLVGVSRKSFLGKLANGEPAEGRLPGSLGATAVAVFNGAALIRTHDVAETVAAVRVAEAIRNEIGAPR